MNEIVTLDVDNGAFETLLAALPLSDGETYHWAEDDLHPVTAEESRTLLTESVAEAHERGWIPQEDPGCGCLTCRLFREAIGAQAPR